MRLIDLDDLLPGEVGWVCDCGAPFSHPLVKGAWDVTAGECRRRAPAFRLRSHQVAARIQLTVDPAA